jgi:hypothetical protein
MLALTSSGVGIRRLVDGELDQVAGGQADSLSDAASDVEQFFTTFNTEVSSAFDKINKDAMMLVG